MFEKKYIYKIMLNYFGRADGLGNRIGELILIETYCNKNKKICDYYWNNRSRKDSQYSILLKSKNINITNIKSSSYNQFLNQKFTLHDKYESAKNIKPLFDIKFENNIKPLGIHIRLGDKINASKEEGGMSMKFVNNMVNDLILYLNKNIPEYIFLCSDDINIINYIKNKINKKINIIKPITDIDYKKNSVYCDFFGLTLCKELYMCSKFSSFLISASLIGNIKINTILPQNRMVLDAQPGSWLEADFNYIRSEQ